ncbi:hypothetical protein [Pseudooceanicola sp. 200-1SW]|uniref:hypothetical protein n=1 Tax=Pseudooceanicola sp. 200-1SW TaxID=3425949 RepID=UPI003D7F7B2B
MDRPKIDVDIGRIQFHPFPVCNDPEAVGPVDDWAQLGKGPAKRRTGIVGQIPEHFAQTLAPVRTGRCEEESQKRTRLA